jgi:thioredoxin 2
VVEAGDDDIGEIAEQSGVPALVDFWAVWCGPCRMVSPVLDQLAHERPGQIKLVKVDVDHSPQLSARFAIQAVPTLMVIVDGKIAARQAGAAPAPVLRSWLEGALTKELKNSGRRRAVQCLGGQPVHQRISAALLGCNAIVSGANWTGAKRIAMQAEGSRRGLVRLRRRPRSGPSPRTRAPARH